ncbi:NAD-dependent epimerase/dehydratase family protein [Halomicrobium mukohataei]|uniref:NAD-dependent epimerase/dehydratase family protein n=1 Tax=Halomicrobium mukohataei TaxID=57705 RepID=A0A847U1Y2_9EURY|nr:NAD-dependent epimerase/dehydratase family protein [Halomicrobium mukohataei]
MQFLTGFPGFLGSALVERLLQRGDEQITCLVQPAYREEALRRRRSLTEAAGVEAGRVRLVEGDITEPDLGLDDPASLRAATRTVYHLAAVYDLGVERALAERVNVDGTEHVLDFAERAVVDRLHYVSTCYVSGRHDGTFTHADLDVGQSFNNHYEATKFAAEVAVQERMAAGLPATIYRPAIAVGDSQTGATQKYDGPYYLLAVLRRQPRLAVAPAPAAPTTMNVVPRDFVVDAIAALSARADTVGEVYQLCNPHPPTVAGILRAFGRATRQIVVPLRGTAGLSTALLERLPAVAERYGLEPAAMPYLTHPTTYTDTNARRALSGTGVACPLFESYADRLVAYAREHPGIDDSAMV